MKREQFSLANTLFCSLLHGKTIFKAPYQLALLQSIGLRGQTRFAWCVWCWKLITLILHFHSSHSGRVGQFDCNIQYVQTGHLFLKVNNFRLHFLKYSLITITIIMTGSHSDIYYWIWKFRPCVACFVYFPSSVAVFRFLPFLWKRMAKNTSRFPKKMQIPRYNYPICS